MIHTIKPVTGNSEKNSLSGAVTRYLISIYQLKQYAGYVRAVDVANDLHVTRPCVTRAVKKLIQLELIKKDTYGMLCLTSQGTVTAQHIIDKQNTLSDFLKKQSVRQTNVPHRK